MAVFIPNHPFSPALGSASNGLAQRLRRLGLAAAAPLAGRLLYRLCLGIWPSTEEAHLFAAGLRDRVTPLPPCCRAMLNVPAAQVQLARILLVDMVRRGAIRPADPADGCDAGPGQTVLPAQCGNPLNFWHGPPIAFLHLEKTAGVTLSKLLTEMFHPAQIDPDPHRTAAPHMVAPFAGRSPTAIRRHALIYGHYDLPSLRQLDPGRIVITMLRDPAARILSLYYFWRSIDLATLRDDVSFEAVEMAHRSSLLEFLECDVPSVRDHIDNVYVRRLTGLYGTGARFDRLANRPSQALALAVKALRQIDFVGVTEEMDRSMVALGDFLGFTPPATVPRENAAATNATSGGGIFSAVPHETLNAAHHRQLSRLTRLDEVVYRAARERLTLHAGLRPLHYDQRFTAKCSGVA